MTAKTMAEVLEEHTPIGDEVDGVPEDEIWCNKIECGFTMKRTIDYEELRDFAAHQAAALSAAGFGLVGDAGAKALEDAANELAQLPYVKPGAPGRAEYELILAVRRGMADAWLRNRAKAIRTNDAHD